MITNKNLPHAIFLDVDGTLITPPKNVDLHSGQLHERNIKAIKKAQALGHKVLINSGRGFSGMPFSFFDKDVTFDGFVTALGTSVIVDGVTVLDKPIDEKTLSEVVDYMIENKKNCRFQGDKSCIAILYDQKYSDMWTVVSTKEEFFSALEGKIYKITVSGGLTEDCCDFLKERFNMYFYGNRAAEGASFGTDKAFGMMVALGFLGIPPERSIAMGDSINDVEVLKAAGTSVAMGNASDEIKALCDMVTLNDADGGVGAAIEKLLL